MLKIKLMSNIPTAEEMLSKKFNEVKGSLSISDMQELMKDFAKLHIENVKALMEAKYYAGETGYIKKEEWQELIDNIK